MFTLLIILGLAGVVLGFGLFQRRGRASRSAHGAGMPMIYSDVSESHASEVGSGSDPTGTDAGGDAGGGGGGD
jgi:hypothetical protein